MSIKNKILISLTAVILLNITACKKSAFDADYRDPSKVAETSIDKQYAGIFYNDGFNEFVMPTYRNYFVTYSPTIHRYIQTIGWSNESNQLIPGMAALSDRWERYYKGLTQYREFEKVYNQAEDEERADKEIFYLTAKIFFYDQTQKQVDLFGDIPWTDAGMLNTNDGNYMESYPKYDKAEDIYTSMLDDLKTISSRLNSITVPPTMEPTFKTQDLINSGSVELWKKYCNSLRLRMLTRVSHAPDFSTRASQEIGEIINNPGTYPIVLDNDDNIQVDVFDNASDIKADIRDALESDGWNFNISGKKMIDHMVSNGDPRLPFIFESGPGAADDEFIGLDQSLPSSQQDVLIAGTPTNPSKIAIYNRSTYSRNKNFPGILVTASEIHFLIAEYALNTGDDGLAKSNFEDGIKSSIDLQVRIRKISDDNTTPAATTPGAGAINSYISNIGWSGNKIELLATQKWLHFNIIQSVENWSEVRRLDFPKFEFRITASDLQTTAPVRWNLPQSELANNPENYDAVKAQDNINNKLFWDVN